MGQDAIPALNYSWYVYCADGVHPSLLCIGPSGRQDAANNWWEIEPYHMEFYNRINAPEELRKYLMQFEVYDFIKKHRLPISIQVEKAIPYTP